MLETATSRIGHWASVRGNRCGISKGCRVQSKQSVQTRVLRRSWGRPSWLIWRRSARPAPGSPAKCRRFLGDFRDTNKKELKPCFPAPACPQAIRQLIVPLPVHLQIVAEVKNRSRIAPRDAKQKRNQQTANPAFPSSMGWIVWNWMSLTRLFQTELGKAGGLAADRTPMVGAQVPNDSSLKAFRT